MTKSKINILFIYISDGFGEDEQLALEDIMELNAHGMNWKIICLNNSQIHQMLLPYGSKHIIALDIKPKFNFDKNLKEIINEQVELGTNIVHIFGTNYLGSVLPSLIRNSDVAIVVSEGPRVKKTIWHFIQSFFYFRIDGVIVPSVTLKRRIQIMRPSIAHKIRVVHPGLDFNIFNPNHFDFSILKNEWGIDSKYFVVGMIASPEYTKSQSAFIKAAASFLRNAELASRTKFVIVGFDADANTELTDLIRLFHLQDQIILVPFVESIPKVLGTLDVYVMPSSKAMFGLQAIESLAMGTPIICANGPDSGEWIGNSQGGLLMRSGDSFDLQRKLRSILEDPEELKLMGKRAAQFAREHFDRNTRTIKLIQVFDRVLRKRSKINK